VILRIGIGIPTYNNPQTIGRVVADALTLTEFPVVVIDDGSRPAVREVLRGEAEAEKALASGRLTLLRHDVNQGKGAALQTAFRHAVGLGLTHLLAIDGDGQHFVREAGKLVRLARENPWDVIIGNRRLKSETVPGISKFGRGFSNFWVKFQTGSAIADSQSGFRIYPLFLCQNLKFWTRHFDFEIEILIRLMWKGAQVREVEIDVHYPEKHERVSHFDKFWDNVRISCLNTVLVVLALLRSHRSPPEFGAALGVGVFIGCTPFFGLHTLLVAGASFLLRLNAGIMFLGSQVSIPPLAPFVIIAAIAVGGRIERIFSPSTEPPLPLSSAHSLHELLRIAALDLSQWLLGSVVLGTVGGLAIGLTGYLWARRMQARKPTWSGRTRGGKLGNGFLKLVLRYFGVGAGYFCLSFIIPYFYVFAPRARRGLNEYWGLLAPELSWSRRQAKILRHLFRFGQVLMDRVAQSFAAGPIFRINAANLQNILGPLDAGQGLILLGAHVGGWDLAASLLGNHKIRSPLQIVEYQTEKLKFNDFKDDESNVHVRKLVPNEIEQPIFSIHTALSRGEPVGLMGDRPLSERVELVPFFGRLAPFDVTGFRVAAATRVPLVFTFGFKGRNKSYDLYASPVREYRYAPGEDRALQCYEWTAEYARELERWLRRYPDQWFNFFPFWSSRPVPPLNTGASGSKAANYLLQELRTPAPPVSASGSVPKTSDEAEP